MTGLHPSVKGRPAEVALLAMLLAVAGVMCAIGALAPPTPASPARLSGVLAVVAGVTGVLVWTAPVPLRRVAVHVGLLVYVTGTTASVAAAATGEGAVAAAIAVVWLAVYAATLLDRRTARCWVAVAVVGLGAALAASPPIATPGSIWILLASTSLVTVETLAMLQARVRRLALDDPLTGVLNRAGLAALAERELAHARRSRSPVSLVAVDLDGFKQVNDRDGHAAGDLLLQRLTAQWVVGLRPRDAIARLGGDEFLFLLPGTGAGDAERLVDRLRVHAVAGWTAGVVEVRDGEPLAAAIERADAVLYERKRGGRVPTTAQ